MSELPDGSIEKLIKDVSTEDLRNAKEINNFLMVLKKKKQDLQVEKEKVRVVVCCSAKDMDYGIQIKEMLATFEMGSFVAHDGVDLPEKVIKRLINGLDKLDVFIPVLSDNFKHSDYCSQELGAAYFKNILIIPLSLDGTVPYGFISGYRSPRVDKSNIYLDYILKLVSDYFPSANIYGKLTAMLKKAPDFSSVEYVMRNLKPHFDELGDEEVNNVVESSIENSYIHASDLCRRDYLPKFVEINKDRIGKDKMELLLKIIKEGDKTNESKTSGGEILDEEN